MANRNSGANYGVASREDHIRSGNVLPVSAYVTPKPDGSGEPTDEERAQAESLKAAPGPGENKSLTPATSNKTAAAEKPAARKTSARKSARKTTRKRK
jgi:hypothetical protein